MRGSVGRSKGRVTAGVKTRGLERGKEATYETAQR
jgi:hypothetical protein